MKTFIKHVCLSLLSLLAVADLRADAAISLNNYDAKCPIYLGNTNTMAPKFKTFVQIWGAAKGSTNMVLIKETLHVAEDGYFDGGIGVITGVKDNSEVVLCLRAWINEGKGDSHYDNAKQRAERFFYQKAGSGGAGGGFPRLEMLRLPKDCILVDVKPAK